MERLRVILFTALLYLLCSELVECTVNYWNAALDNVELPSESFSMSNYSYMQCIPEMFPLVFSFCCLATPTDLLEIDSERNVITVAAK